MRLAILRREPVHSIAGPYALDALDDAERDRFERHLRGCASCQDEVRGFTAVAAALAEAVTGVPPAGLRDQVLAACGIRQLSSEVPLRRAGRGVRKTRPAPRSQWLPRLALTAGVAGLAASAGLGGVTVAAQHGQSAAQAQAQAIAAVLSAPDARLMSAPISSGGSATVVASVRQGKMVFVGSGLRPLPGSRVYQLWFIGRTTRSAGLVPTAISGRTASVVASGLAAGDKIGVTVEPAGGSSAPTTAPVVLMTLSAGLCSPRQGSGFGNESSANTVPPARVAWLGRAADGSGGALAGGSLSTPASGS
jgi:anti-sigma-K factor RskA